MRQRQIFDFVLYARLYKCVLDCVCVLECVCWCEYGVCVRANQACVL